MSAALAAGQAAPKQAPAKKPATSAAQQNAPAAPKKTQAGALEAKIAELYEAMAKEKNIPGTAITVSMGGTTQFKASSGWADVENKVPMRLDTVSRIGSVSKTITAVAIMQLEEAGKLKVEDPPQKYCAAFPQKASPMTIAQVLSHIGGVRHYKSGEEFLNTKRYTNVTDAIAIFANDPLANEPGTKYLYSSWGYNLLGCVIEGASGMKYSDYVLQNIGKEWKMTRQDEVPAIIERRAHYYSANQDGSLRNAPLGDVSDRQAAGGWMSTTSDIAAFGNALLKGELVKSATFERMMTAVKTNDGKPVAYGYGLVPIQTNGRKAAYHTGESIGASAILYMEPDTGLVIAMLWNKDGLGGARLKLAQDIAEAVHSASIK